jgi:hypothetical protein
MDIDLIKRSIRLDRQRLQDTSSDLLIQKNIGKTAVIGRSRAIKERINKKFMELEHELVTLTKKWFIDRDITQGDVFKQTLKLFEEMGELCAGYAKQKEQLTKDSIGDCAVVVVGLAMMIELDPVEIMTKAVEARKGDIKDCFELMIDNASEFQFSRKLEVKINAKFNLLRIVSYLKAIAHKLGYDFVDCFELAYNEIKDRKGRWVEGSFVKEEDLESEPD